MTDKHICLYRGFDIFECAAGSGFYWRDEEGFETVEDCKESINEYWECEDDFAEVA